MQDTYVYTLADSAKAMASYYQSGRPFRMEFLDLVYGDKNIYSTVRDIYKWDQALRNGQLFTKGVLDSAYAGYSFEKPGQRNYGLGWRMLFIPNGKKLIYHNGWWHGNRTVFIRMLDENATIIALSNNDYKNVYSAKRLCDLFGDYRQGHEKLRRGRDRSERSRASSGGEPHEAVSASGRLCSCRRNDASRRSSSRQAEGAACDGQEKAGADAGHSCRRKCRKFPAWKSFQPNKYGPGMSIRCSMSRSHPSI